MRKVTSTNGNSSRVIRLTLMISSIILLLLFQSFWLASSYEQAYIGFRRETSALLRSTVFSIRDSLFVSVLDQFQPGVKDSLLPEKGEQHTRFDKIAVVRSDEGPRMDVDQNAVWADSVRILGVTGKGNDSVVHHKNFVIRIRSDDTLSTSMLHDRLREVMARADISSPFVIRHFIMPSGDTRPVIALDLSPIDPPERDKPFKRRILGDPDTDRDDEHFRRRPVIFSDTLVTEHIPIGPIHAYAAVFPAMRTNVISRIAPQIIFSAFLTAITVAAFIIMYRSLRSQERVMEMKNDFISNVTHELKTPIATVSVALEALRDFHALKNPAKTAEYLGIAHHELNRLSLMTDKILKASIFEQQGVVFVPGLVKMDDIVKQVTESLTVVLDKKHIKTMVKLNGTKFDIQGSDMHLTNVVYNLLDNAIKYSSDNTSINIDLASNENNVTLVVRDQGIGIDAIHHKRIFERFFRVPTGDVHNTRGYGLGLNYVADVVRSHGGTIKLESALGKGSCFTLNLPKQHGS